ncbi:unnamed protein product, partial [Ectocarpus sp. 12 AP-2014]
SSLRFVDGTLSRTSSNWHSWLGIVLPTEQRTARTREIIPSPEPLVITRTEGSGFRKRQCSQSRVNYSAFSCGGCRMGEHVEVLPNKDSEATTGWIAQKPRHRHTRQGTTNGRST